MPLLNGNIIIETLDPYLKSDPQSRPPGNVIARARKLLGELEANGNNYLATLLRKGLEKSGDRTENFKQFLIAIRPRKRELEIGTELDMYSKQIVGAVSLDDIKNISFRLKELFQDIDKEESVAKAALTDHLNKVGKQLNDGRQIIGQMRTEAYARIALTVDATAKALENRDTIRKEEFEKHVSGTAIISAQSGRQDLWAIFNSILSEAPAGKLFKLGETRAEVAVEVGGKILQVVIEKVPNRDQEFDVQVGQYYLDVGGKLTVNPINEESIRVLKAGDLITATDPITKITISQSQFIDRPHQVEAILATVGEKIEDGIIKSSSPAKIPMKSVQLITAGTGSGKSGILASAALIRGEGIFAVPDELVSDMVSDANSFIGVRPATIPGDLKEEDLDKFLTENPYVVASHTQLMAFAHKLTEKNIFVDEAHQLGSEENKDKLRAITSQGNEILCVTATPNKSLYDILGQPVFDLSLYKAQHEIKTVRQVKTQDIEVDQAGLAENSLIQLLTRSGKVDNTMKKYDGVNQVRNIRLSSQMQGMLFSDDATLASEIHGLLSNLDRNQELRAKLNEQAAKNVGERIATVPVDIYEEVSNKQSQTIESSIQIEILMLMVDKKILDRGVKRQDLQELVRNGRGDEVSKKYEDALGKLDPKQSLEIAGELQAKGGKNVVLKDYFDSASQYLVCDRTTDAERVRIITELQKKNSISMLLTENSKIEDIEKAKELIDRGLILHIVSSGPLSTGYSNTTILNTLVVQGHPIHQDSAATCMQQYGRAIRSSDGFAFVTGVCDKAIPAEMRNLSSEQVFHQDALKYYNEQLVKEEGLAVSALPSPGSRR